MTNHKLSNELLKKEYEKYIKLLRKEVECHEREKFCLPLLFYIYPDYITAKKKILIIGQETKGWDGYLSNDSKLDVNSLVDKYKRFEFGRGDDVSKSQIFRFSKRIYKEFNQNCGENGFIWTSISKLSYLKNKNWSTPPDSYISSSKDILGFDLLSKEINIIAPDIVVFAIGQKYKNIQEKIFPNIEREIISLNNSKLFLNKLKHPYLPDNTFETINPGRLRFVPGKEVVKLNEIVSKIKENLT